MTKRWLLLLFAVALGRAARVRLSVAPRRRQWAERADSGDFLLVALGDSLTQGIGSSRMATSWLGRYVTHLEAAGPRRVRVDNRAVYGAKIADLLAHQLPLPATADQVTVCIGANDAGRTDPGAFRRQLRQLCGQLPAGSVVGDVPEFQWGPRVDAAAELSQIVREVVAEFSHLSLAPVQKHTAEIRILTDLAGDFFHPADRGYLRIADAFIAAGAPITATTGQSTEATGPRPAARHLRSAARSR
ncbi:hypothetical protein BH10ACT8_BH10ACT8_27560 [soil metagenome]